VLFAVEESILEDGIEGRVVMVCLESRMHGWSFEGVAETILLLVAFWK
jgi:hypothetical protein